MCYYNGIAVTKSEREALVARVRFVPEYDFWDQPLIIGPQYPKMPMLRRIDGKKDVEVVLAEWGFLPSNLREEESITDFRGRFTTLNAKVENLFVSEQGKESMFAGAALEQHCLIPSTHFFEHRHLQKRGAGGKVLKSTEAFPYLITMKDNKPFYFAGIWNHNKLHGDTLTILTTEATGKMSRIHNLKKRMPVILTSELAREWMFTTGLTKNDVQRIGSHRYDTSKMKCYTVGRPLVATFDPMQEVYYPEVPPLDDEHFMITPQTEIF